MAVVAPTLWGSGASRRRQSLPDDLHDSQSCPGDSEHQLRMGRRKRRVTAVCMNSLIMRVWFLKLKYGSI